MDSMESSAEEVESENELDVTEGSAPKSEINCNDGHKKSGIPIKRSVGAEINKAPIENDDYSVDFEDEGASKSTSQHNNMEQKIIPLQVMTSEDDDYAQASFEEESRASHSGRHLVHLSFPVRKDSSPIKSEQLLGKHNSFTSTLPPNSPNVNLDVLSRSTIFHSLLPSSSVSNSKFQYNAQDGATLEDGHIACMLRKIESKYHDEVEELREQATLLSWKEKDLRTELRVQKEKFKQWQNKLQKKKKRATERRAANEKKVTQMAHDLEEAHRQATSLQKIQVQLQNEKEAMQTRFLELNMQKDDLEKRNMKLAEQLQHVLSDYHTLNTRYKELLESKQEVEQKLEECTSEHRIFGEVLRQKHNVELETIKQALQREIDQRLAERQTLPETHKLILEAQKERYQKLEESLLQDRQDLEAQVNRELARIQQEIIECREEKKMVEERTEKRLQIEFEKISREREAIDQQRRDLILIVTASHARMEQERNKLEEWRAQLEAKQMKLVEEKAEMDARATVLSEASAKIAEGESLLDMRKRELTRLGRETYEKSVDVATKLKDYENIKLEVESLRGLQNDMNSKILESEKRVHALQVEKVTLEKSSLQLQREKILVARQRMETRQILDGARKLDSLLRQRSALDKDDISDLLERTQARISHAV